MNSVAVIVPKAHTKCLFTCVYGHLFKKNYIITFILWSRVVERHCMRTIILLLPGSLNLCASFFLEKLVMTLVCCRALLILVCQKNWLSPALSECLRLESVVGVNLHRSYTLISF